jgi:hypothetical protein
MSDIATENFKTSVGKAVDHWKATLDGIAKKLAKNGEEIAKLEAIKSPTPDDKKRLANCLATRAKLRQEVEAANLALLTTIRALMKNPPPLTKDNQKDLAVLPGWAAKLIKDKGVQVLKGVTIVPTVDLDFKAKKINSLGIKITW